MEQFKIINKIGEGAYSTVYTVERFEDGKIYALKKVKIKKLTKKEQTNALNEVRILASVESPYVIGYKDSFIDETDQTLCIVMEYADDGDLYQKIKLYIKNKTFFMEHDIWRIFIQITKGLHDLHEYNILHRDLKSANVFLFRDGSAKLGDLNVSKITTRGLGYTQTGTPYYASPEVWKDNPYNLKSDIWSLGCVFYELIMLTTPFKAKSMKELFEKVKQGNYPPIPNSFSPKFQIVIDRILKIRPEDRPDAGDILNMPEILDKIEEYGIFNDNNKNQVESQKNELNFSSRTEYKKNENINYFERVGIGGVEGPSKEDDRNNNCDIIKKNNNIENNIMAKKKKTIDNKLKIRRENRFPNINKSVELNNNINMNLINKYEIFKIYNHNISYFQEKYKEKKKVVLKTIKYPKKLKNLNDRLPGTRYSNNKVDDYIKKIKRFKQNNTKIIYPLHKLLPRIRQNRIEKNINKEKEEEKNEMNDINNPKSNNLNDNNKDNINNNNINDKNKFFIMNTLQKQINQKNIFNNKGKIDIIIIEE